MGDTSSEVAKTQNKEVAKAQNKEVKKQRMNKLYRTPPTPTPDVQIEKEKGFVLDSNAVSNISSEFARTNPKLGPVLPPYNAQNDIHVANYFEYIGVKRTLNKTGQKEGGGCSIEGPVMDEFSRSGYGHQYLTNRNQFGAGHSRDSVDGHAQFLQDVKPVTSYNGKFGFRRNTPWLRQQPSPFGTASRSPTC